MLRRGPFFLLVAGLAAGFLAGAERSYVGAETCAQCHDQEARWLAGSVHEKAALKLKSGKLVTGCETCHGPGSAHIEALNKTTILTFTNEPAARRNDACLACHEAAGPEQDFRHSEHTRRGVACDQCHASRGPESFHRMRAVGDVLRGAEPALCYRCHAAQRAEFSLPYHHPVGEKFMGCTSCHTPHGAAAPHQLRRRDAEAICGKCHEDQLGPFVFEHPPGRAAGCQVCHQPHGSTNPKLLTRFRVQFLCLECHTDTPSFHDLTQAKYQNCTACHSRIHGSNLSRKLLE